MKRSRAKVKQRVAVSHRMWGIVQEERRLVEVEKRERRREKWEKWLERKRERAAKGVGVQKKVPPTA